MKILLDECLPRKLKYDLRSVRDNDYWMLTEGYEVDDAPLTMPAHYYASGGASQVIKVSYH